MTDLTILDTATEAVHYQYEKWCAYTPLYREAEIWWNRHPLLVTQFMEKNDVNGLERVIRDHLRLIAQHERAMKTGFHVDDVVWYTPAIIAELLPLCMDIEATLAPSANQSEVRGAGDPHGQGGFIASLIDVRNAWITTPFRRDEMQLLKARYVEDLNWAEIAASYGHDVEEAKKRVAIGLRRMVDTLGGWRGRGCPATCPDCTQQTVDWFEKGEK